MAIQTVDDIPWGEPPDEPTLQLAVPRRCRHPRAKRSYAEGSWSCECGHTPDPAQLKTNRNNRKRGTGHERKVAGTYGGEPVGALNLPEDIRGQEYRTQVKTHVGLAPAEWRKAFAKLEPSAGDGRTNRLILRYLPGMGIKPDDYIVIRGQDWLDRFGRDEDA